MNIEEVHKLLYDRKTSFDIKEVQATVLDSFYLFNQYASKTIENEFEINIEGEKHILNIVIIDIITDIGYTRLGSNQNSDDDSLYLFGLINLPFSIENRILIEPKSYIEKLFSFIKVNERNSKHRKFFSKYNLYSDDIKKENFGNEFLNFISNYNEVELEIINDKCLFRINRKPIDHANMYVTIHLGFDILKSKIF